MNQPTEQDWKSGSECYGGYLKDMRDGVRRYIFREGD